ncbi:peptidoglycan DD-metalloendopeptidase family protein [Mucilaginibacter sp. HD30]
MLKIKNNIIIFLFPGLLLATACSKMNGPAALFKKSSPHDVYADNLRSAGLERTEMGRQWLSRAANIAGSALAIKIPYKETGFFAPEKTQTVTLSFNAVKGQKINIAVTKKPALNFNIYADVFASAKNGELDRVAFADTTGTALEYEINETGKYYLRLQPELLSGGQYTLSITAGPSLGFPVSASANPRIGSFYGDGRDEGNRLHEGIDIFAPKRSPAVAAANGVVTSVRENTLGGKVVFMRPDGKDYSLYYAHLDSQMVNSGQNVRIGDTLGLVGNTGNARYTPSHLHFGVYTGNGTVDPLYFVNREVKKPHQISAPLSLLNATVRINRKAEVITTSESDSKKQTFAVNTPLTVNAATANQYKVTFPDGNIGYIESKAVATISSLKKITLKNSAVLFNAPDSLTALPIAAVKLGDRVDLLGTYQNYQLVKIDNNSGWIAVKD